MISETSRKEFFWMLLRILGLERFCDGALNISLYNTLYSTLSLKTVRLEFWTAHGLCVLQFGFVSFFSSRILGNSDFDVLIYSTMPQIVFFGVFLDLSTL